MRYRDLLESYDLDQIRQIAEQFRAWMEGEGFEKMRSYASHRDDAETYRRFEGMCNRASWKLADIYREQGFPAVCRLLEYHGNDLNYWQQRGRAFYNSDEDFEEADPWEYGESHQVVLIDDIIIDVTADQFNPTNPDAHSVVVTKKGDRRYR
jgi:hypothetical protein